MDLPRQRLIVATVVLAAAVTCIYAQVFRHEFLTYDDRAYVSENPVVVRGLTPAGLRWAFTTTEIANWHPLTWVSHMLDVQLFGLNSGAHHLMNVAFHLANVLLLFGVLNRLTGASWPSLTVAALFALHPLHIESVAWLAERKDVLSTFWGLIAIWAYLRYAEYPSWRRYAAIVLAFACALMAKPMLVTLPGILLLLDFWPLCRMAVPGMPAARTTAVTPVAQTTSTRAGRARRGERRHDSRITVAPRSAGRQGGSPAALSLAVLVREKVPLFAMSVLISAATYTAQRHAGAVVDLESLPATERVANALVSYVRYLGKAVWPVNLAIIYPHDTALPPWQPAAAAAFLIAVSVAVLRSAPRHPYLLLGWLWYLGTLVPVIGLVQVGAQAYADRYTYLPLVGIFVMLTWGGRSLLVHRRLPTPLVATAVVVILGAYAAASWAHVAVWRTSETLLSHTVDVTRDNFVAENNLGFALTVQGKFDAAIEHFRAALRINPDYSQAYNNLGAALTEAGRFSEAIEQYDHALRHRPNDPETHHNLGVALARSGQPDAAIGRYEEALRLQPDYVDAHYDLGVTLGRAGRYAEAIAHLRQALQLRPDLAAAHNDLGAVLARTGDVKEAVVHFRQALQLDPNNAEARRNLQMAASLRSRATER